MKYGIVVDSGCDLRFDTPSGEKEIRYMRAPLKLRVGEKEFTDDFSLNISEFMEEMEAFDGPTGSAAPSPQDWYDAYKSADEVFAFTITGTLSGTHASAVTAQKMLLEEEPDKKIYILDSKSAGPELSLLVQKLTEYLHRNLTFEQIIEKINAYHKKLHLLFVLGSMDNLIKNGRISSLQGKLAGMLGIRVMGTASDEGTLELLHKCRGREAAYKKVIREMERRNYAGGKVIISHCCNEEKALALKGMIRELFPQSQIQIMPTSGLCSYYAERGGILLGFEA